MGIIAPRLKELKLIDSIIPEPLGGAHRNPEAMAASLKAQLLEDLADLDVLSTDDLKPSLPAFDELRLRLIIYLIFPRRPDNPASFGRGKMRRR